MNFVITNINYKAFPISDTERFKFCTTTPQQCVIKTGEYTIIIFRTGSCRIMGCKKEPTNLPFNIKIERIQSLTVTSDYGKKINLYKLANFLKEEAFYEPELFPALRFITYNPLCVNVFASGKVVFMGLKTLACIDQLIEMLHYLDINILFSEM